MIKHKNYNKRKTLQTLTYETIKSVNAMHAGPNGYYGIRMGH